jgi:hypothetical protein
MLSYLFRMLLLWRFEMKATVSSLIAAIAFLLSANAASAQVVMQSEPPPGQLGPGQVIYVACGPGKARKVTGGSNVGANGMVGQGKGRQRGPCVPMKH